MKKQLKNITMWIIPIFTTFCSVVYMDLAIQNSENNLSSVDIIAEGSELSVKDKTSATHFE
ncbi:MAG: hypothetical protein AB8B72_01230 [Crocinitomicaceae bacterium]